MDFVDEFVFNTKNAHHLSPLMTITASMVFYPFYPLTCNSSKTGCGVEWGVIYKVKYCCVNTVAAWPARLVTSVC